MKKTILFAASAALAFTVVARAEDAAPAAASAASSSAPAPAAAPAASARKSCDELKTEIGSKLDAKGVKGYTLNIVTPDEAKDGKVVGSCDGGKQRIVYKRG
jgi:hypothetical protein